MGLDHLPQHAEVTRTIEEASDILGVDIDSLDNAEALNSTAAVQPALLIAGVATARALMAENVRPVVVAGMSIGAFGFMRSRAARCHLPTRCHLSVSVAS